MMHPFVTLAIDVLLSAERPFVELHLGALIDHGAGVAGERHAVLLALEEVLPDLRADLFKQETNMRRDRIVAQNCVVLLQEIANAEQRECAENHDRNQQDFPRLRVMVENPDTGQQGGYDGADRQHDVAWREWQQQRVHRNPQAKLFLPPGSLVQPMRQAHTIYGSTIADVTTGGQNIRRLGRALLQCSVMARRGPLSGCAAASRGESCPAAARAGPAKRRWREWRDRYDRRSARNRRVSPPAGIAERGGLPRCS